MDKKQVLVISQYYLQDKDDLCRYSDSQYDAVVVSPAKIIGGTINDITESIMDEVWVDCEAADKLSLNDMGDRPIEQPRFKFRTNDVNIHTFVNPKFREYTADEICSWDKFHTTRVEEFKVLLTKILNLFGIRNVKAKTIRRTSLPASHISTRDVTVDKKGVICLIQ